MTAYIINKEFLDLPKTFSSLFGQICQSYFRNFFKNTLKALLATATALFLPEFLLWLKNADLLSDPILYMLQEFAITPDNLLRGCLLSSLAVLTVFSFIDKIWFVGIFKSIGKIIIGALGWLNLLRNSATTSFAWGIVFGFALGWWLENPMITLTIFFSTFLAGIVPEKSGLVYFARFFWNRFYQTSVLNSGLKPADEFFRGVSPGLILGFFFMAAKAGNDLYLSLVAVVAMLLLIGFFRQRRNKADEKK